jgi:superfamily II DNA or RNA helicase
MGGFSFDFGVFDEAHRTATKTNKLFSLCLNVPVKKKLFMTATPRLYLPHLKERAKEEDIEICSMDDEDKYGKVFDEIKFGEAIKLGLLSDYKIKVIVVSNSEVAELINRRYWVDVLGKEITLDELAKAWALIQCMKNVSHVISFHSRIKYANDFSQSLPKIANRFRQEGKQVSDIKTFHIAGSFPAYERSNILNEFISKDKSVVTNAKCLTEGVDVPEIDGVYFADPKKNIIDIVQATGRAIRKKKDSRVKYGNIIIPIFIKDTDNEEEAISSSAFKHVYDIVEAMSSQDERFSDIIEKLKIMEGRKKFGSLKSRERKEYTRLKQALSDRFDCEILPIKFNLQKFMESVTVTTLYSVGKTWDLWYGQLVAFYEKNKRWPIDGSKNIAEARLSTWCGNQRTRQSYLPRDKIDKLNEINFPWDIFEESWNENFNKLKVFYKNNKRWPNNNSRNKDERIIASWCHIQRNNFKNDRLSQERVSKLKGINFSFDPFNDIWEQNFNNLDEFYNNNKRWPQYNSKNKAEVALCHWCRSQRTGRTNLSRDKIDKLNKIGFIFEMRNESWSKNFNSLKEFNIKNKKWPSQWSDNKEEKNLSVWCSAQRTNHMKGKLSADKVNELNGIQFKWEPIDETWNSYFNKVEVFYSTNKRWPTSKNKEEASLSGWCSRQRVKFAKNSLSRDKINKLKLINFDFTLINNIWDEKWDKTFNDLKEFHRKNKRWPTRRRGSTNLGSDHKKERILGNWYEQQKSLFKKGKLSEDKIKKLESIGFVWDTLNENWNKNFNAIKEFYRVNRRWPRSSGNKEENKLDNWCKDQKYLFKKGKLSQDKISKLDAFDFRWELIDELRINEWDSKFNALKKFYSVNKRWPIRESKDVNERSLATWTHGQKSKYIKGKLSENEINKLLGINFKFKHVTEIRNQQWDKNLNDSKKFYTVNKAWPTRYSESRRVCSLAYWLYNQRQMLKKGKLSPDKIKKLKEIGLL